MEYEDYDNLKQIQKSLQSVVSELEHIVLLAESVHTDEAYKGFITDIYLCAALCGIFGTMIERINETLEWTEQKWDE